MVIAGSSFICVEGM